MNRIRIAVVISVVLTISMMVLAFFAVQELRKANEIAVQMTAEAAQKLPTVALMPNEEIGNRPQVTGIELSWSPDSLYIAAETIEDDHRYVSVIDAGDGSTRHIMDVTNSIGTKLVWASDSNRLLISIVGYESNTIYIADLTENHAKVYGEGYAHSFSPTEQQFSATDDYENIMLIDVNTGQRQIIGQGLGATWSKANLIGTIDRESFNYTLLNTDGSVNKVLTGSNSYGLWSFDGRVVLYQDYQTSPEDYNLWSYTLGENEPVVIASTTQFTHVDWSPNRFEIVHTGDTGQSLYIMNADGSNNRPITDPLTQGWYPAWSPSGRWIAYTYYGGLRLITPDGTATQILIESD